MRLHHVGVVVADLEAWLERMVVLFGARTIAPPLEDPLQRVRVAFIDAGTGTSIEGIEPLGDDSPVAHFLGSGGGLNHLCFEVQDLDAELGRLRGEGCLPVSPPKPARAFGGRRVAFLYTRERQLVELVES